MTVRGKVVLITGAAVAAVPATAGPIARTSGLHPAMAGASSEACQAS